jgi:hypothetical protein
MNTAFHIPGIVDKVSTTLAAAVVKGRILVDGDLFNSKVRAELILAGKKTGGGAGYLVLYDFKRAEIVKTVTINEANTTIHIKDLTMNLQKAKLFELQIYTDGAGEVFVYSASLVLMPTL